MPEFWAIDHGTNSLAPISTPIDLSTVCERSLSVRYTVKVSRVLLSLQATYPEESAVRLSDQIKTSSSDVNIFGSYVVKRTHQFTDGAINTGGVLTWHGGRVGFYGKLPGGVAEVKTAGCHVLSALQWLHDN
eukprot:scaffold24762_cov107-Amphora_coffeaeformis.AAC.1